jgi:hypothetical protein
VHSDIVIVGLTSFGVGCARPGKNNGNTINVAAGFADWIKEQICDLSSERPSERPFRVCFSGHARVDVLGRGPTMLSSVKIGDKVIVRPNKYEPV